jgi:8-oxo-dGTP diphosphatase
MLRVGIRGTGREYVPLARSLVAGVLVREDRVLLCHRSPSRRWYPNVWDLPGGHVVDSETVQDALVRELAEEIGIAIAEPVPPPLTQIRTEGFDLAIYRVPTWEGTVRKLDRQEHDALDWFSKDQLRDLPLAHPAYLSLFLNVLDGVAQP